jgi:tellurite resistance protein
MPAREWFLAKIVEVGLADGSLSRAERAVAEAVARYLGMTMSQGEDVISLAEEAAQAG